VNLDFGRDPLQRLDKAMKSICLLAILLFAIARCVRAQTGNDGAVRLKITALEGVRFEAYQAKNPKTMGSILDDRALVVNDDGSMQTKGESIAALRAMFSRRAAQKQQLKLESLDVKIFGNTAVAIGVMWAEGIEHGKPYRRQERYLGIWKYKDGSWLIIGSEVTPILH
jgi:ketosteroid isomerase-like protein